MRFSDSIGHSIRCYTSSMSTRGEMLGQVMSETGTTQTMLSRLSGVRQPSISQFLSGRTDLSDEQLDRLLSCMGFRLEVVRRPVVPELTHSERRSWMLHRRLSLHLDEPTFRHWLPKLTSNLTRVGGGVQGQVHRDNVQRWERLIREGDLNGLRRVLTGLDRHSIEMREVTPFGGLLPDDERREILQELKRAG